MKAIVISLSLLIIAVLWRATQLLPDPINPLLGDISFVETFGALPTGQTDEKLRIKTHLAYVEKLLLAKDVSALPPNLRQRRAHLLDLLRQYWQAGVFPKNYDRVGQRVPCFIDKDDNLCAVGYLIAHTAGRAVAERISAQHQYEKVLAMRSELVDNWVASSGLTKTECAMIQPNYWGSPTVQLPPSSYNYIPTGYGVSSSVLSGINLSLVTVNGIQLANRTGNKTLPIMGALTGLGQIILGVAGMPGTQTDQFGRSYTNESQKGLALVNIGVGTATLVVSALNLFVKRKVKEKTTTWNLYGFPTLQNTTGLSLNVTRRF